MYSAIPSVVAASCTTSNPISASTMNPAKSLATGACLALKTSLFKELGGLDPMLFAHMEEIDLCWRMQRAGYDIWAQPESTVFHLGGATLQMDSPKKTFLNFRNNLSSWLRIFHTIRLFTCICASHPRRCSWIQVLVRRQAKAYLSHYQSAFCILWKVLKNPTSARRYGQASVQKVK